MTSMNPLTLAIITFCHFLKFTRGSYFFIKNYCFCKKELYLCKRTLNLIQIEDMNLNFLQCR